MADEVLSLWTDVARCKADKTCSRLTVQDYWYEPNPGTRASWISEGLFERIDTRVVFVCESPTKHATGAADFNVPGVGIDGWRCWGGYNAISTDQFWDIRREFGLEQTWITNVVKCGAGRAK